MPSLPVTPPPHTPPHRAETAARDGPARPRAAGGDRKLRRDLRTLALFIETYCECTHHAPVAARIPVKLRPDALAALLRRPPVLCPECARLLGHAAVMRSRCPYKPKPMCKDCPTHCYPPYYRTQIRTVMRIAGWRLLRSGRLHYLLHLLF